MTTPIDSIVGEKGQPPTCKVFSKDIAMHWFKPNVAVGEKCLCGKTKKKKGE